MKIPWSDSRMRRLPLALYLENELAKANTCLSDPRNPQVRDWLINDQQFQITAQSCLRILAGKKVIHRIPFDLIVANYRMLLGGSPYANLPSDKSRDMDKLEDAIFKTWKERYPDLPQKSFGEI